MSLSPQDFVTRYRPAQLRERAASQSHFIDLCHLVGHPTPTEDDPIGDRFTFEAGVDKLGGGSGWADVWKRGYFAWEYKGKHGNLEKAYQQLQQYRDSLQNPPLLVVSDMERIVVHTNFTNTVKQTIEITLDNLLTPDGMRRLRAIFYEPDFFKSPQTTEAVTTQAAQEFAKLAEMLQRYGEDPQRTAHFLIRLLFCLFSEDIGLLPKNLFTDLIMSTRSKPAAFRAQLQQLFGQMATGGWFGPTEIEYFDGGLFNDDTALDIGRDGMEILVRVARLDWSSIEPSIFGTLFERSLDPSKRSQLGAHYTSRDDILLIVEPVLMAPLRREWAKLREELTQEIENRQRQIQEWQGRADRTAQERQTQIRSINTRTENRVREAIFEFMHKLASVRVLDPACGSGNFLYVALRLLLDLWKEVALFATEAGLPMLSPLDSDAPSPAQLFGIELNSYAYELAQVTIWIGWIQWAHENGYGAPSAPILKPLDNIKNMDAILAFDEAGNPYEPEWPEADVVIGNPPFLGDKKMRAELGYDYVDSLRTLFEDKIPGQSDLVCYWFEKARELIEQGALMRVGLLATQGIRGGANRTVLDRIVKTGGIFWAYSDRNWILDGATVHVSLIAFDDGSEENKELNGSIVDAIHSDLSYNVDLTKAQSLTENSNLAFIGTQKGGKFDIDPDAAKSMLEDVSNPHGKPNSDVVRPWVNGRDLTQRPRNMYIIDFGIDMSMFEAAMYEKPFEYLKIHIKAGREAVNSEQRTTDLWWIHQRSRPEMRSALAGLTRYIGTPRVAKHRMFVWLDISVLPDSQVVVFAREDDFFFGVLHSLAHEVWARATGTQLREAESGFRYSQTMTFETFPFPWPPGKEPTGEPRVEAIAQAAKELVKYRDQWLNPSNASESELKKRTLTNLYNAMPTWLKMAHEKLDKAVFDAYGWPHNLSDDEILSRLLALNLERAGATT